MVTEGQKVRKKHWRPDFTLDFSLSEAYFLDFIHVIIIIQTFVTIILFLIKITFVSNFHILR